MVKKKNRETGQLAPLPRGKYRKRKVDISLLKHSIKETPDATLEEFAEPFKVYPSTIFYHLKKLGITRKKQRFMPKEMKKKGSNFDLRLQKRIPII